MSFAYEMGLRGPRCNGCQFAKLKHELGDRIHVVREPDGWTTIYEKDAAPRSGQGDLVEVDGRPVQFKTSFMSIGHSDECYHWRPPTGDER